MGTDRPVVLEVEGASGTRGGGRYVILRLFVADGHIQDCSFESNGCPFAHLAVGGLVTFIKGRRPEQAALVDPTDLLLLIGGLPDGKGYYADMAVEALQNAVAKLNALSLSSQPVPSGVTPIAQAQEQ